MIGAIFCKHLSLTLILRLTHKQKDKHVGGDCRRNDIDREVLARGVKKERL